MNTLKFPKIIHVRLKDPSCRRDIDEMWERFSMFQRNRIWILIFHIVPHSIFSIHMLCCRCHMWKAENVESCGLLIKIQRLFLGSKNFKLLSNFVNSSQANLSHSTSTCIVIMSCEPSKILSCNSFSENSHLFHIPLGVNVCSQFGELSSHSILSPYSFHSLLAVENLFKLKHFSLLHSFHPLLMKNYIVRCARCCNSTTIQPATGTGAGKSVCLVSDSVSLR